MTLDGWRQAVARTAEDPRMAALVAQLLHEQDHAKEGLRRLGLGCVGMPWADVVRETADRLRTTRGDA